MAKRVSRLLGPWRNIFACLQPTVDCQRLRCSKEAKNEIVFRAVLLEIPNTGLEPINSDAATYFTVTTADFDITDSADLMCDGLH